MFVSSLAMLMHVMENYEPFVIFRHETREKQKIESMQTLFILANSSIQDSLAVQMFRVNDEGKRFHLLIYLWHIFSKQNVAMFHQKYY